MEQIDVGAIESAAKSRRRAPSQPRRHRLRRREGGGYRGVLANSVRTPLGAFSSADTTPPASLPSRTRAVRRARVLRIGRGDRNERYPILSDAVSKSRGRTLQWASEQVGLPNIAAASVSEPFDAPDMPGVKFGVAVSRDGATWVARMERPDREVPQRTWMTEASVVTLADSALFAVRNTCSAPAGPSAVPRSVPNFVKKIAKLVGLYDADEVIDDIEWTIEDEEDLQDLYDLVTSSDRFLPVVLVTHPSPLDVRGLARSLFGVAHVVAMPDAFTRPWSDLIGKRFAAYFGAVRTYYPGVDVEASDPFEHPLVLRGRIPMFTVGELTGPDAFRAVVTEHLYAERASRRRGPAIPALRRGQGVRARRGACRRAGCRRHREGGDARPGRG